MPFFDMPLEQLEQYQPPRQEPDDFGAFWQQTLSEARQFPLHAAFERVDSLMPLLEVYDVTYSGFGGQPIKGWFILPVARSGKLPCIVEYIGYGGGRGLPVDWLHWAVAGYAHFVMDTRGQGSTWRNGDTPDNVEQTGNPQYPGVMTRGILDPHTYYYRRVYTDAVRAVEAARSHPTVDADRVVVLGGSQGGGITLAVAGLMPDLLAALPDVPFLCHYRRATQIINTMPYAEISAYLKTHRDKTDAVFRTLSYFDGVNFAARANAPALFSVGLMDPICPPSTVYAAYNHYAGARQIAVYEYNEHEGGGSYHHVRKLQFLQAVLQS